MSAPTNQQPQRILSIDILRGAVMIIMALDHARDYFHLHAFDDNPTNLATTTPALFFTRWITHFCAPVFVFLSGTSAFLASQKKSVSEQSIFLIKRGLWLVFAEISIVTLAWTFNPIYNLLILQVIWAIGWSMVILGLLVRTSRSVIIIIGCILFFGHNLLDYITLPSTGNAGIMWNLLFKANFNFYHLNDSHLACGQTCQGRHGRSAPRCVDGHSLTLSDTRRLAVSGAGLDLDGPTYSSRPPLDLFRQCVFRSGSRELPLFLGDGSVVIAIARCCLSERRQVVSLN